MTFSFFSTEYLFFCISFQYTYLKKLLEIIENTSYFTNFCDEILFDK